MMVESFMLWTLAIMSVTIGFFVGWYLCNLSQEVGHDR